MASIGNQVHNLFDADMDYGTAALTNEMETLTVKEPPRTSDASLIRHVTLEAESAYKAPPRPSFDLQTGSQDLLLHLDGDSSEDESIRPSKMSMGSMCSTGSFNRHRGSAPFASTHAPIQSHDFVETPLMKQDEGWGSRPVQGRDWGNSCTCDLNVIDALLSDFEESGRRAGVRDSFGSSPSNAGSTQRFARSTNLALDMEENIILEQDSQLDETLQLQQDDEENEKKLRRRKVSYAKHKRMSLWASTAQAGAPLLSQQKPLFRTMKSLAPVDESMRQSLLHHKEFPLVNNADCQLLEDTTTATLTNEAVLSTIFSCLNESELLSKASLVCTAWADAATSAHARLMMTSVGYVEPSDDVDDELDDIEVFDCSEKPISSVALSMQRSWQYLNNLYPWGCFLSEGAFKRVYKVHNSGVGVDEALSVMDVDKIVDKQTIAAELVVSSMLSSLARRAVCPNFILTHGVFTCPYEPPESRWGSADNKRPKGDSYVKGKADRRPREPGTAHPGRYQYIRMELCTEGDAEEFVKRHPDEELDLGVARMFLFQIAFALHAAADKFSMKHYDLKLLNVFVQDAKAVSSDHVVLRYGLGSHVFALKMSAMTAVIAKLADYGTANIKADSNGQPATIAQFTTLENTPPDYMILGDKAKQGHGHDAWGLGLCMLHLFTGHAPYEEILEEIKCPPGLKKKLRQIWENENVAGYEVIHSVVLSDVYKDEAGNIIEGEPDETLYDTLYRFLVLFGIPVDKFQQKACPKVWQAISESLEGASKAKKPARKKGGSNASQFHRDCKKFSIRSGNNQYIARARQQLESVDGGMDLLFHLCSFDPDRRASAMDVLNSSFMEALREPSTGVDYGVNDTVHSYTAFWTQR
jgi:serine/threonine protein kinase